MSLTLKEQKLLISMMDNPTTSKSQKIYKSRVNFYKAIWKFRDAEFVVNREIDDGIKEWKLTLDGVFLAKFLRKVWK